MPPGVLHWVMGTSNAICIGRHFYSASTIRSSIFGIVNTFVLGGSLTNESHVNTRTLLYQLIVFWSMRIDQTDIDGKFYFYNHQSSFYLIYIYSRCSYPCPVIRGRIFRHHLPWHFHSPLTCFRRPFLLQSSANPPR